MPGTHILCVIQRVELSETLAVSSTLPAFAVCDRNRNFGHRSRTACTETYKNPFRARPRPCLPPFEEIEYIRVTLPARQGRYT